MTNPKCVIRSTCALTSQLMDYYTCALALAVCKDMKYYNHPEIACIEPCAVENQVSSLLKHRVNKSKCNAGKIFWLFILDMKAILFVVHIQHIKRLGLT